APRRVARRGGEGENQQPRQLSRGVPMHRRLVGVVAVTLVVAFASFAAAAPTSTPPPPPPNPAFINAFWPNLTSLAGNKSSYASFEVRYDVAPQRLVWS